MVQQAVAAEREQFISDVRSGKIVIDGHASKADRRAASTWQLSDEFVVFDSEWAEKRQETQNLYDAGEATSLRDLVFKNPTRDQDATKISKRHNFPTTWHDAPIQDGCTSYITSAPSRRGRSIWQWCQRCQTCRTVTANPRRSLIKSGGWSCETADAVVLWDFSF